MPNVHWEAVYNDGTSLKQFEGDKENKYTDIDRTKLEKFILFSDGLPKVVVHLDENKKLICRKRVAKKVGLVSLQVKSEESVWLVGWQERRAGVNVQMVCALFEDGRVEVVDRFKEGHPWLYPVKFLPEEVS